ncbi:hypothetical protein V6Z12_A06G045400 [Gossypium hirsutum]
MNELPCNYRRSEWMILKQNVERVKGKSLGHDLGGIDNLKSKVVPGLSLGLPTTFLVFNLDFNSPSKNPPALSNNRWNFIDQEKEMEERKRKTLLRERKRKQKKEGKKIGREEYGMNRRRKWGAFQVRK